MLDTFLTQTIEIRRQGEGGVFPETATLTTKGRVLPLSGADLLALDGQVTEPMKLFCPIADIAVGDRAMIEGATYEVSRVKRYEIGSQLHLELVISKTS